MLPLEPEAAEHDRARGRQAEGKDEQRPFDRGRSSAPTPQHYILCLWHGSALIRCGSLLTNCSGTLLYQPALSRPTSLVVVRTYTYYYIVAKAAMAGAKPCNERCRRQRLPRAAVHNNLSKADGGTVVRGAQGGVHQT